jgi:plasmid stabilization system protein ParE
MRTLRFSKTFERAFDELLAQGEPRFGVEMVARKRAIVLTTIATFLAAHPNAKTPHPRLGLVVYPVSKTPFVVLYDFDDHELRVHFILHKHASLDELDVTAAEW